jgi:hypothetical protein
MRHIQYIGEGIDNTRIYGATSARTASKFAKLFNGSIIFSPRDKQFAFFIYI